VKINCLVKKQIKAKLSTGEITSIPPGEVVFIESEKAKPWIEEGKLEPLSLVENMDLEQFSKSCLGLIVESSVLGDYICFTSNEEVADELRKEGFICYTAKELQVLFSKQLTSEQLVKLHEIKKVFPECKIIQ